MELLSDQKKDYPNTDLPPGGYEWWYFDAIDLENGYKCVIIFYRANPFSLDYMKALENNRAIKAEDYPAVSISIYRGDQTVYYSFTEFAHADFKVTQDPLEIRIDLHSLQQIFENGSIKYILNLDEQLPGGDSISGELIFESSSKPLHLNSARESNKTHKHTWNLTQPRAQVTGTVNVEHAGGNSEKITWRAIGYHDHNTGREPMKNEFDRWYWGRFHFNTYTLIYYAMFHQTSAYDDEREVEFQAWLMNNDSLAVQEYTDNMTFSDLSMNLFALFSKAKIEITGENMRISIQQQKKLDNGPFYQRFLSNALLHLPDGDGEQLEAALGITEFIRPDRIYSQFFWPLVKMRITKKNGKPHWVQKYPRLYRWTW